MVEKRRPLSTFKGWKGFGEGILLFILARPGKNDREIHHDFIIISVYGGSHINDF